MTQEIIERIDGNINDLIADYDTTISGLFNEQNGGKIRGAKGRLVERLANSIVRLVWDDVLLQSHDRLQINNEKEKIYVKDSDLFLQRQRLDDSARDRIINHFDTVYYDFGTDVHVKVDGQLAVAIECKAYTETAMLKRIIFDSMLMDEALPDATHCLFQLEAAFSDDQYNVLMSHHSHNIDVLTLLDGKRNSQKPIHREAFFKELTKERLITVIEYFEDVLSSFVTEE